MMVPITEVESVRRGAGRGWKQTSSIPFRTCESEMPITLPKGVSRIYQIKVQGQVWAEDTNWKSLACNGISTLNLVERLGREEKRSEDILPGHSYTQNLERERKTKRDF